MARRKSRFIIGLFVSAGFILAVVAIVWLGASNYLERGAWYVTYFDESVQGLQVDSRVKYRGVDVGKVQSIGVAPDHRLVEVIIKIDMAGEVEKNTFTQLKSAGITGIVFIELDRQGKDDTLLAPPTTIHSPYPAIPSKLSQSQQLFRSLDRIIAKIEDVDLKGISDQIKKTTKAAETFLDSPSVGRTLANVEAATATLDHTLQRIDLFLADTQVAGFLEESRKAVYETRLGIGEARSLIGEMRVEVAKLKTGELSERGQVILEGIERRVRGMSMEVDETAEAVRQAVDGLKELIERLKANPSDLLFSQPPVVDVPERGAER